MATAGVVGITRLSRLAIPRLRATTDPGSGLFGIDLAILDGVALAPRGFKTLVEILARSNWTSLAEIPYRFEARRAGTSNATLREGLRFAGHLVGLARDPEVRGRHQPKGTCIAFGIADDPSDGDTGARTLVLSHGN